MRDPSPALADWLRTLGLERFAAAFADNEIDLDTLPLLSDADLQHLGLPLGPRRKLLDAIAQRRGGTRGAAAAAAQVQEPPAAAAPAPVAEGERRQITAFFCDMVGFTEIASRVDPEVLRTIIRAYEDTCAVCITRYEGYVYQRLGDGVVAFFGYPLAQEGEAERAIHAGLAILDALARLEVPAVGRLQARIGITTGLVVVSGVDKGAVGAAMNLAARLQALAGAGQIAVSESVRRLAAGKFVYEDLGAQSLKGFERPVNAYRVLGISEIASRFDAATLGGLTPMVGREQEIGLLMDRWTLARGGEGQVVLLSGEPGVGKSRVLETFRQRLTAHGARILQFQCSPFHASSTFFPLADHLQRALGFGRDEAAASRLAKLEDMVVARHGRPREDVRYLAEMLAIPTLEVFGPSALTPQRFLDETMRSLVALTTAVARSQPSLMVFEDLHWIDPTSLAFLDMLVGQSRSLPLLIVLTHRPGFAAPWIAHDHVSMLTLSKLSRSQCGLLVSRLTQGRALPPELLDSILARTDGVPLFVEELTKYILESSDLRPAGDAYEYRQDSRPIDIPATLRGSLMARLDHHAEAKEIAQIGAVIGREFSLELMLAVAPRGGTHLQRALQQLVDAGLIFQRGLAPELSYVFKHALVQDVAYDSLLKSRRQELHASIASAIEQRFPALRETKPEVLAQHLSAAGRPEASVPLWRAAAELATRRMALQEAVSHLNGAVQDLAALPPSPARDREELGLHASLGTVYMLAKGWAAPEVKTAYARAQELSASLTDADDAVWTLWGICVFHLVRGEIDHARSIGARIMALAEASGGRVARLVAHMLGVQLAMYAGRFAEARAHWAVADELYDEAEDRALIGHFSTDLRLTVRLHGAHILWIMGQPDEAAAVCAQKDELARSLSHPYSLSWSLTWGAIPRLYQGKHRELLALLDEGIAIADEHGIPYTAAIGRMARGWAQAQLGEREAGITQLRAGLAAFRATGAEIVVPFFQTLLAELLCQAGQADEALALLEAALAQVECWGERWQEAEIHRVRGMVWASAEPPDAERSRASLQRAVDVASSQGAVAWEWRAREALTRLPGVPGQQPGGEAGASP